MWLRGKKQGTTSDKKRVCVFKGLEQTGFCGTLGNRSGRLSSRKLWANINEAFRMETKARKGARLRFSENGLIELDTLL